MSSMPEYNGSIGRGLSAEAQSTLERFRQYVFSVTQLESYGRCPFQFFADKVLRLNVLPELEEGLTPLERGGILHEILFEFYVDRRTRHLPPIFEVTERQFDEAVEELVAIARRKIDELDIPDIFWSVEKELLFGARNRRGILQGFLDAERERPLEVVPAYFEVAFGGRIGPSRKTDPDLIHEQPILTGNVRLRGKVDRIEIGEKNFTIIDYKTGATVAKRKDIELGLILQLPVYLYAVERILSEKIGKQLDGVAGTYYLLRSTVKEELGLGNKEFFGKAFSVGKRSAQLAANDRELRSIIDQAIVFVNDYVDRIAGGEFPVQPKIPKTVCKTCDFQTMCRIRSRISVYEDNAS